MAEQKTFNLTAEDLQNIINTAVTAAVAGTRPAQQTNVVQDIATATRMDQNRAQAALQFNQRLLNSEMVQVSLPVSLADYFGDTVTVSVNGNTIKIPVDGNAYMITKAHNQQLQKKIMYNNKQLGRIRNSNSSLFGNIRGDIEAVRL